MTLALDDLGSADIRTVIVTSSDISGRLVGKRFSPDVFRRLIEDGVALSSCVLKVVASPSISNAGVVGTE